MEVQLAPGIYRFREPLSITNKMGFHSESITGRSRADTVICGSIIIEGRREHYRDGIYCTRTERDLDIDMLYVNGKEYHMARYPKYDESVRVLQGYASDCISKERAAGWSHPEGGYFHVLHNHRWGTSIRVVDCLITRTGRVEKQTAAIQVSMSRGLRIANCTIYEVPRAAINFSEGNFCLFWMP